jgi:pimeloyl-ACP methyl ester carboxylesterase
MSSTATGPAEFRRERINVNGVGVTMLTAGAGDPLVFFHGAGTFHGFDFALPWASKFKVMIPYHPGWGTSDDAPEMTVVGDYMLHYLEMFDQLGIEKANLVGISMGGRFAATFGMLHRRRVRKLVLICPAGLVVPEHPLLDLSKVAPQDVPKYLVNDLSTIAQHTPASPSPEFLAERARERASFERLMQTGLVGPWPERWAHRINVPTLIVWGDKDRLIPPEHAQVWNKLIAGSRVHMVPGAGHLVPDEKPECVEAIAGFLA